ncbi:MAG: hypothetical protein CMC79_02790 [Flavobacteriaceae bacterium]|nr:hypothetical protein [Flavobacteriaceae bacterium]|tara:strand:+ start:18580 stop:18849 length:270 start_codon:yes stop_codon:yes gene_type:complete
MYLSEAEEWFAIFICICIVIGFTLSTIQNIRDTISEEKEKEKQKQEEEEKIKELIKYMDTKSDLIDTVIAAQEKLKRKKESMDKKKSKN